MSEKRNGQTIGCNVTSCRFNKRGCVCELESITVEPCCDCHSGDPADESMCGSYEFKA